jgi:PhnB protein
MQLNAYLSFNGQCEEAFNFYTQCFGGSITGIFRYGETPMAEHIPAEMTNAVMHVRMSVGQAVLMGADAPDQYETPKGIAVSIHVDSAEEAERIYASLSENGSIQMPIQETFWALRFAMFTDRFGIPWMINCEKPM